MKAREFLQKAIDTLADRGSRYESGQEENSMREIVDLHAMLISDIGLSELEGWFFMLSLKLIRLRKSIEQGKASNDSIVDLLGYTAKLGECLFPPEEKENPIFGPVKFNPNKFVTLPCRHLTATMTDREDYIVLICDNCSEEFGTREYLNGRSPGASAEGSAAQSRPAGPSSATEQPRCGDGGTWGNSSGQPVSRPSYWRPLVG
jgi:hypothetical protein